MTMDLFTDMNLEPAPLPAAFYNSTGISGKELKDAKAEATKQDAQVVMFLYRPEYYGITEDDRGSTIGIVDVIVAKNSNGPTGTVRLNFDGPTASVHESQAPYDPMQGFKPPPDNRTDPSAAPF
jgi:replicative DNA helicase